MKATIISIPLCHKCETLKTLCPNTESVTMQPNELLPFARAVGLREMPFVVISGDVEELKNLLNKGENK